MKPCFNHKRVLPHEFKRNAEMIPKIEVVDHVDDVVLALAILQGEDQMRTCHAPHLSATQTHSMHSNN